MKLYIYSTKRVLFEGEVSLINLKTLIGEITVLNHHRPIITAVTAGVVRVVDGEKKEHHFNVRDGFLEVNSENQAKLLVDENG